MTRINNRSACARNLTLNILIAASFSLNTLAQNNLPAGGRSEILFTDSQGAIFSANSGAPSLVAAGQKLVRPLGIAIANNGDMIVSDTGCGALLAIDASENQRVIAKGGALGVPYGIAIEKSGSILAANARFIIRVNAQGQQILSSGPISTIPIAVTVAPNGDIFAVDALGIVVQVDPATGAQTRIAGGGYLKRPQGIAVLGNHIYVTDVATPDGNFGTGIVIDIDRQTGNQTLLSLGDKLVGPVGIAIDDAGKLVVGDPYTINPATVNSDSGGYDGAIISIDRASGAQNVIARGQGDFVNPRCVAIVHAAD